MVCLDDDGAARLAQSIDGCVTYGTHADADYRIAEVSNDRYGAGFDVIARGVALGRVELPVPGLHNVRNAVASLAMAVELGADAPLAVAALERFAGVARRFEFRGERDGVVFVDDYAHLPTEVEAAIAAAAAGDWQRVVAVFQPHRFSRTAELWDQFADSFQAADHVVLTGIYPAGEQPRPGITGDLVMRAVLDANPWSSVAYLPRRDELRSYLADTLRAGDLCLTLGAGDLTSLPDELLAASGVDEAHGALA